MADIKVVIQLQDTTEDEISSLGSSAEVSNASIQNTNGTFNKLSTKGAGANLKSWAKTTIKNGKEVGYLSLADGYVGGANTKLISQYGYNGYVFGVVPASCQFTVTLEVVGSNIDSIVIYGDKLANQYPTKAYKDGDTNNIIYSDDAVWAIKFSEPANSHTITFLEWNRPEYNACITYVGELKNKLVLDKSWIKSIESLSQATGQPQEVYYGAVYNRGDVNIVDVDNEMHDYILDGIIDNSNINVDILCNGNKIQEHIIQDSEHLGKNNIKLSMTDNLLILQNLYYSGYKYDGEPKTLLDIFNDAVESLSDKIKNKFILDKDISIQMSKIKYQTPFVPYMSYLDFFNKVCQLTQSNMFQGFNGNIVFKSARPVSTSSQKDIIVIPSKNIKANSIEKDMIVKNKINRVEQRNSIFIREVNASIQSQSERFSTIEEYVTEKKAIYSASEEIMGRYMQGGRIETIVKTGSFEIKKNPSIEKIVSATIEIERVVTDRSTPNMNYVSEELYSDYYTIAEQEEVWKNYEKPFYLHYMFGRNFEYGTQDFNDVTLTYTDMNDNTEKTLSLSYGNSVSIKELEDRYVIDYSVLVFTGKYFLNSVAGVYGDLQYETKTLSRFNIVVNGVKNNISFLDTVEKFGDASSENYISLSDNELNQKGVLYDTFVLSDYIAENILNDYKDGVTTASITLFCSDLFNTNGDIVKSWNNGEIIQVGDIIRVDKDNEGNSLWAYGNGQPMYWKVTGRNFRKVGVPMIDLELQEVRVVG